MVMGFICGLGLWRFIWVSCDGGDGCWNWPVVSGDGGQRWWLDNDGDSWRLVVKMGFLDFSIMMVGFLDFLIMMVGFLD